MQNQILKFEDVKDTYISFIRETLILIKGLIESGHKEIVPYYSSGEEKKKFFVTKVKHIWAMSFIGLIGEHLIKLILLKKGYTINEIKSAKLNIDGNCKEIIVTPFRLISFGEAVELFKKDLQVNYFSGVKEYIMNPHPHIYDKYSYFGFKTIKPDDCVDLLVKVRNSYIHYASPQGEQNGIIWYLYNFLIWIVKKEFHDEFEQLVYIGSQEAINLWPKI